MLIKYDGNGTMKQEEKSNLVVVMEVLFFEGVENLLLYKVFTWTSSLCCATSNLDFPLFGTPNPFHPFASKKFSVFSASFSICYALAYSRVWYSMLICSWILSSTMVIAAAACRCFLLSILVYFTFHSLYYVKLCSFRQKFHLAANRIAFESFFIETSQHPLLCIRVSFDVWWCWWCLMHTKMPR